MPDIRRDQYQISHIFHVITRGNSKQILFHTKSDFKAFRTLMQRLSEEYHIEIFCYCLMDNHVHMIIRDEEKRMSLFVRDLCSGFAKVYNTKYNHSGHVFQGRFKSCPINTRAYFLNCFRYILKNPEKVGISYDEYEWSSWQSFVNGEVFPNNLFAHKVFESSHMDPLEWMKGKLSAKDEAQDIMEYDRNFKSDEWALGVIQSKLNLQSGIDVQKMPREERDEYLRKMFELGLGRRQIERLTGVCRTTSSVRDKR